MDGEAQENSWTIQLVAGAKCLDRVLNQNVGAKKWRQIYVYQMGVKA